jgi:hypothetical protein
MNLQKKNLCKYVFIRYLQYLDSIAVDSRESKRLEYPLHYLFIYIGTGSGKQLCFILYCDDF